MLPSFDDPAVRALSIWYAAERQANPDLPDPKGLTYGDLCAIALPRVRAVFAGEVRWSEASAGDRAVWRGRSRTPEAGADYANLWDTISLAQPRSGYGSVFSETNGWGRLFGNANVGNYFRSNMQVAGQTAGDEVLVIEQMYAVPDRALVRGEKIFGNLIIGNQPKRGSALSDLVLGQPVGIVIPQRQNFAVQIDWAGLLSPLEIRIHLEGRSIRTQR